MSLFGNHFILVLPALYVITSIMDLKLKPRMGNVVTYNFL